MLTCSQFSMASDDKFLVVFDLDGCVWAPEMYELWYRGGSPFSKTVDPSIVTDRKGEKVRIYKDLFHSLGKLYVHPKVTLAIASSCDEPDWAREIMDLFEILPGVTMTKAFKHVRIMKASSKKVHLTELHQESGIPFGRMVFLDNEYRNIAAVAPLGVACEFTPQGGSTKHVINALKMLDLELEV
eukprot:GDKJ01019727.1.p1 GENE.GDKJ01019727.1~~GDKJ01019727.1.p1  ORF type:complete len:185 (-),score=16.29 GDKJ01019727.1:21-575(-)